MWFPKSPLKRAEARAPERGVLRRFAGVRANGPVSNQTPFGNYFWQILSFSVSVPMRAFLHRVEMLHRGDVEHAVRRRRRGADRIAEFGGAENFFLLARGEHVKAAAPRAEVNFAIGDQRRSPRFALDFPGPIRFSRLCIQTVERPSAIRDEDQIVVNRWRGHHMLLQRIRPHQTLTPSPSPIGWERVAGSPGEGRRVDALQPRLVLAPKVVATARYIDVIVVKDGHAINVTRAFAAVAEITMNLPLRRGRGEVELPDFFQL